MTASSPPAASSLDRVDALDSSPSSPRPVPGRRSTRGTSPSSLRMLAGLACGAVNGFFVAYVGMSSFVVTLGMMSIAARSRWSSSGNQMLYQFGPDKQIVEAIGQSKFPSGQPDSIFPAWIPAFSSHFWVMILLALIVGYVLNRKPWAGTSMPSAAATRRPDDWASTSKPHPSSRPMSSRPSAPRSPRC